KDEKEAKRLILLSAQKGNVTAMGITCSNFLMDQDYTQGVYWARKASAQGNKVGIAALSTLRTLADMDLIGAYTDEQRQAVRDALKSNIGSEPAPTPPSENSPLERAKANSID